MLLPLVVALAATSAAVGYVVQRRVQSDLIATVDREIERAILPRAVASGLPERPEPGQQRPPGQDGAGPPPGAGPLAADDTGTDFEGVGPQQVTIDDTGAVLDGTANSEMLAARDLRPLLTQDVVTLDGTPRLRAHAADLGSQRLVVATSLEQADESLSSLRRNLLIGIIVLVAVQTAIAAFLIRLVNRPLTTLSSAARRIAEGDLETAIDPDAGARETAELGADLQVMVDRLTTTITEREAAAADAEQARSDTERFMADVSHELHTPLTSIKGYADLHIAGMLDGDAAVNDAMHRISDESGRLTDLVQDLLQLLRPSDSRSVEQVDLAAIASAAVQDLRAAHPDRSIELALGDEALVVADAALLHQAVINLGANACHHTPPDTHIVVRLDRRDGEVRLSVEDDGPGIEPEVAARVLQPFVRGDASRARSSHDGSGLGLAITDRIARQHDGRLEIESTLGVGTTFTLTLPAAFA